MPDDEITLNGRSYSDDQARQAIQYLSRQTEMDALRANDGSQIRTPADISQHFGRQYNGERDIYDTLSYPEELSAEEFRARYRRQDIARRIVDLPPKDTWRQAPTVTDTEGTEDDDPTSAFEQAVADLFDSGLRGYLQRVDIAAGIGEYAILLLGVADDSGSFASEVNTGSLTDPEDIAYYSVFAQDQIEGWELGKDVGRDITDPKYNEPVEYEIDFGDIDGNPSDDEIQTVHHSRVIHVPAEGAIESDLKGTPRLRPVYNRLTDLEKVVGASAEMFWSGADRKFQFDIRDGYSDLPKEELARLDDEVKRLVHDLEPYIKTSGMDMNVIGGEDPDPSAAVDSELKFISGSTGIPLRKLIGSERGDQASTQDRYNWFDQVEGRQENYAEPRILRPLLDRLIEWGVLPEPQGGDYDIEWPNLFSLTKVEKADVQKKRATAAKNVAPKGNTDLLPGGMDGAIEYLESGEFPDEEPTGGAASGSQLPGQGDAVDESNPETQAYFDDAFGVPQTNENRYGEGDVVSTPDGKGLVVEPITKDFEHGGESHSASEKSPTYVVALAETEGVGYYKASELTKSEFDVPDDVKEKGVKELKSNTEDAPEANADTTFDYPETWEESEIPARVILLDAFSSMGGTFRGCRREGFSSRFCASMKDRALGTEDWRGGWAD